MIDQLTRRRNIVLATGGGAVLREDNRRRLSRRGLVVYLDVDLDVQIERTSRDKSRPLLQRADLRETLTEMARQRGPIYKSIADIRVSTSRQRHRRVVDRICRSIELRQMQASK